MAGRRSALDPIGPATDPFGSAMDLNGLQTGPPLKLSKRTRTGPIRTPLRTLKFNGAHIGSDMGPIKSVPER